MAHFKDYLHKAVLDIRKGYGYGIVDCVNPLTIEFENGMKATYVDSTIKYLCHKIIENKKKNSLINLQV